ncbi:hypothetical protein, partial [Klebsiella pneumoniae]|uniref:hypothetical protein n=1 Tax=Klebsiella pneumoniae TaxID=573 RepID=UPI0019D70A7C
QSACILLLELILDECSWAKNKSVLCPMGYLLDYPAISYFLVQILYALVCDSCWSRSSLGSMQHFYPVDAGGKANRD